MVSEVVRSNVQHTVDLIIERSRVIRESVAAGKVKVVGAVYDIETGETSFLVGETASV